jgi:peroxidase
MWRERRLLLLRLLVAVVISAIASPPVAEAAPSEVGFYRGTCPVAEDVVLEEMRLILMEDKTLAPSLLRMHYHDCFVQVIDLPEDAREE